MAALASTHKHGSLLRNVASNWLVLAVYVVTTLVATPLVVRALGQESYGIWSFLNGLVGYTSLLYLGAGSALVKHIAAAGDDTASINRLASVTLTIFGGLGVFTLVVFGGLSPWVPALIATEMTATAAVEASLACALLGVQTFCAFLTAGYAATLVGRDRFDLANLGRIGAALLRFVVILLAVRSDRPFARLVVYLTFGSLVELAAVWMLAHGADRTLRFRPALPRPHELRILYRLAVPALTITVAMRLIHYTDTTVIGLALGAASVGIYALPQQLIEYARTMVSAYASVLLARLAALHAQGHTEAMRDIYLRCARVTAFASAFVVTNLLWFGVPFLEVWAGPGFGEPVRWVIVWLGFAMFFGTTGVTVATPFYDSMHQLEWPARILVGEAVANFALSVILARPLGVEGVAIATFLPAVGGFLLVPRRVGARLGVSTLTYLRVTLGPAAAAALAVSALQVASAAWLSARSPAGFVVRVAVSGVAGLAAAVVIASPDERREAVALLRRLRRRHPEQQSSLPLQAAPPSAVPALAHDDPTIGDGR